MNRRETEEQVWERSERTERITGVGRGQVVLHLAADPSLPLPPLPRLGNLTSQ